MYDGIAGPISVVDCRGDPVLFLRCRPENNMPTALNKYLSLFDPSSLRQAKVSNAETKLTNAIRTERWSKALAMRKDAYSIR